MLSMSELEEFIILGKDTGKNIELSMRYFDENEKVAIKKVTVKARPITIVESISIVNRSFDSIKDDNYRNIIKNRHNALISGDENVDLFADIPVGIVSTFNAEYNKNYLKAAIKDYIDDFDEDAFDMFISKIDPDSINNAVMLITEASGEYPTAMDDVDKFQQDTERKATRSSARV